MSEASVLRPGRIVNRADLADFLGVSLPTVDGYVRRGCPFVERGSKGREWRFNSKAVVDWLRAQDVEQALGATDTPDIEAARLRKVLAEAQLAELELARQRGASISQQFFHSFITAAFTRVRTKLLA